MAKDFLGGDSDGNRDLIITFIGVLFLIVLLLYVLGPMIITMTSSAIYLTNDNLFGLAAIGFGIAAVIWALRYNNMED